jgi:hypothetical protein
MFRAARTATEAIHRLCPRCCGACAGSFFSAGNQGNSRTLGQPATSPYKLMRTASRWTFATLVVLTAAGCAAAGAQAIFASPDEAASVLLAALDSDNYPLFLSVAGQQMAAYWSTGEPDRDALDRGNFVEEARRKGIQAAAEAADRRVFYAGGIEEPFPAPLVKTDTGWRFDGDAGSKELTSRRIHRNEVAVVELCQRFRDAEYEYLGITHKGVQAFAERIRSRPGQHDGLFWADSGEEDQSPMGPPFAAAAFAERQPADGTRALFGYYFKILAAQGPDAAGGALDYRTKGRLRKGFALIAWPAEYGVDGAQSFLINHFGDIYQRDLGADTSRIAEGLTVFNPDRNWRRFTGLD